MLQTRGVLKSKSTVNQLNFATALISGINPQTTVRGPHGPQNFLIRASKVNYGTHLGVW